MQHHAGMEEVIGKFVNNSAYSIHNNIFFLYREDYYKYKDTVEADVDLFYNDGYHGKGNSHFKYKMNKVTGKISG